MAVKVSGLYSEHELGLRLLGGELLDEHHAIDGKGLDLILSIPKTVSREHRRGGVGQMWTMAGGGHAGGFRRAADGSVSGRDRDADDPWSRGSRPYG